MERLARFLFEVGHLKRVARSGWWVAGIRDPESVAEHTFRSAWIAYFLALEEGVDPQRAALMALVHDLHEARINDHHKVSQAYLDPKQVEALAADERLGLSHAGSRPVDGEGRRTGPDRAAEPVAGDLLESLLRRNHVTTSTVVVPRAVHDRVGLFDEDLRNSMDWDLWLRIAEGHGFHAHPETVCLYRFHEVQKIKDLEAVHECRCRIMEKALERCRASRPDLVPLVRRLLAYRLLRLGRYRLRKGDRAAAAEAFRDAKRHRPLSALTALRYQLTVRPRG